MASTRADPIAQALRDTLISPNEADSNMEPANIVDAVVKAARLISYEIKPDQRDQAIVDGCERIASALEEVAHALDRLSDSLQERGEA